MLQQAIDFREESEALFTLLDTVSEQEWEHTTQFKGWTLNDVVAHIHFGNSAADLALQESTAFSNLMRTMAAAGKQGTGHLAFTHTWLHGRKGRALLQLWRDF